MAGSVVQVKRYGIGGKVCARSVFLVTDVLGADRGERGQGRGRVGRCNCEGCLPLAWNDKRRWREDVSLTLEVAPRVGKAALASNPRTARCCSAAVHGLLPQSTDLKDQLLT